MQKIDDKILKLADDIGAKVYYNLDNIEYFERIVYSLDYHAAFYHKNNYNIYMNKKIIAENNLNISFVLLHEIGHFSGKKVNRRMGDDTEYGYQLEELTASYCAYYLGKSLGLDYRKEMKEHEDLFKFPDWKKAKFAGWLASKFLIEKVKGKVQ